MKYIYPDYYSEFHCIADQCPSTCCQGWAIEIDEDTLERYRTLGVKTVDYEEKTFLQDGSKHKRCLNLDQSGLCSLIMQHGEDILCDTCRLFPRHVEEFEGVREYSLTISCPEVSRMILSRTHPVGFEVKEDETEEEEEYDEYEQMVYARLVVLREQVLTILQNRENSLDEKCRKLLTLVSDFQDALDGVPMEDELSEEEDSQEANLQGTTLEEVFSVMEEWEYMTAEFPVILEKSKRILFQGENNKTTDVLAVLQDADFEMRLQQIIVYFVYAHFCGSAYDEYYYGMAQLAVCAAVHIRLLCKAFEIEHGEISDFDVQRLTSLYARELEHSNPNMLATEAWMEEHRI